MKRFFISMYTDGPSTSWNVIDRHTQEWVRRFASEHDAQEFADKRNKTAAGLIFASKVECPSCRGRGYTNPAFDCRWCKGTGEVTEEDAAAFGADS